jgi:hypothetical protein
MLMAFFIFGLLTTLSVYQIIYRGIILYDY